MFRFYFPARILCAFLFLVLGTTLPLHHALAGGNAGNITGTVVDQSTGKALTGATVKLGDKTVSTNTGGKYAFTGVSTGRQIIMASAAAYKSASVFVTLVRNMTVTAPKMALAPSLGSISGTVTDNKGAALAHVSVSVGNTSLVAQTNSKGAYSFPKVATGAQTLTAFLNGYNPASQAVNVTLGKNSVLNFTLTAAQTSTGGGSDNVISWDGTNGFLAGNNYAWQNYSTDFGTGGWGKYTNWSKIGADFATMHAQQVKVVRWWVFGDGRYSPEFVNPAADSAVAGLDNQFFADVDTALQIAHDNHIYLLPCLVDFYMFAGQQSSGGVYGGAHPGIAGNATIRQSYLDNALKPFLQHVAASPYRAQVLAYDICNEPEFEVSEIRGGPIPLAQMRAFVQQCADYIHQYGGGAYATLGSGEDDWVRNWTGMGLDFYQIHWYPNFTGRGLPTYASLKLDHPCIVGEFPTANNDYIFGSDAYASAQYFLDTIYKQGYAGALGWGFQNTDAQSNWGHFRSVFANWVNAHDGVGKPSTSGSASLVKIDTTTQGTWKGVYGADGCHVLEDTSNYPAYANGWGTGNDAYVWPDKITTAALQKAASTDRLAACWYAADSFVYDLNLADGQTHQVAFYIVDYDKLNRAQTVEVLDAVTNTVLHSQALSSFQNGVYLVYNMKGHVRLRFTNNSGTAPNAVFSGVFFN